MKIVFLNELYFDHAYVMGYSWVDFRLSILYVGFLSFLHYFFNVK